MKTIIEKITKNKSAFESKFFNVNSDKVPNNGKIRFSSGWGDGWGNGKSLQPIVKTNET